MLLKNQKVLITGGSRGIGRGSALACARHGADIGINASVESDAVKTLVDEIQAMGRKTSVFIGDVADPAAAPAFIEKAVADLGGVDTFVANAGICPFHSFLDMPVDLVKRVVDVNLMGTYYMCQAAANQMVKQGRGGSLIAISSISALVGGEMQSHYTPTKAGQHSLMQSVAIALGKHKIRANSILPGTIATDINKEDLADPAKREYMEGRIPLGRLGDPDDIGGVVVFLASDLAKYMTGAHVLVDGGAFVHLQ
jgi:L-rhamnose 1-dehydrogenase